jgi:predicted phosphate transport protein (TIGR00153 family)
MAEIKGAPLRRTRFLQTQIDEFLDAVSEAALAYQTALTTYVRQGWSVMVEEKAVQIRDYEERGDRLRGEIGTMLYTEMLLPDTVGDVLSLLVSLDHLLDVIKVNIQGLRIERPTFPPEVHEMLIEMVVASCRTVDQTVLAVRAYFRDPVAARDQQHKIHYFEDEAERAGLRVLQAIFEAELPLEEKRQLREHVLRVDRLADLADDAGDALAIFAVKRTV